METFVIVEVRGEYGNTRGYAINIPVYCRIPESVFIDSSMSANDIRDLCCCLNCEFYEKLCPQKDSTLMYRRL